MKREIGPGIERLLETGRLMRKIALNLFHGDSGGKTSIRGRRTKAGWDDEYMERLLTGNFMR